MKRVFETTECEEVRKMFLVQRIRRYEKHENQMKGCAVALRVSDLQVNVWTSWARDTVKARRGMADDQCDRMTVWPTLMMIVVLA